MPLCFWCKCMRFKTVKGYLVNDHIIVDNKTLWLTKDSKRKCKGYFLVKWLEGEVKFSFSFYCS